MIGGSETGSSFKQALFFMECGLNLHDTMIWVKKGGGAIGSCYTYTQNTEYMFVFSKGKPSTFNPIIDVINSTSGNVRKKTHGGRGRVIGKRTEEIRVSPNKSKRNNWWYVPVGRVSGIGNHPAVFPEKLACDHIISWSNKGDLVYDPFLGSGTTAKAAKELGRYYVGSEISESYFKIAEKRLSAVQGVLF